MQAFEAATPNAATGETNVGGGGLMLRDGSQASFVVASLPGKISAWNGKFPDPFAFTLPGAIYTGLAETDGSAVSSDDNSGRTDSSSAGFDPAGLNGGVTSAGLPAFASSGVPGVGGAPLFGDVSDAVLKRTAFGDLGGSTIASSTNGTTVDGFNPVTGASVGALLPTASASSTTSGGGVSATVPTSTDDPISLSPADSGPFIAAVPEPGTVGLVAIGLTTLLVSTKRASARRAR
jgi:hypothetical protein